MPAARGAPGTRSSLLAPEPLGPGCRGGPGRGWGHVGLGVLRAPRAPGPRMGCTHSWVWRCRGVGRTWGWGAGVGRGLTQQTWPRPSASCVPFPSTGEHTRELDRLPRLQAPRPQHSCGAASPARRQLCPRAPLPPRPPPAPPTAFGLCKSDPSPRKWTCSLPCGDGLPARAPVWHVSELPSYGCDGPSEEDLAPPVPAALGGGTPGPVTTCGPTPPQEPGR